MYKHRRIVLTGLAAALALGSFVALASARRIALSSQSFRVTWTSFEFEEGLGLPLKCPVTIEGSFHSRTISKVLEQLIGYVTKAIAGAPANCTGGTTIILTANLPWHVRYNGFSGTLPTIREIHLNIVLWEFLVNQNIPLIGRVSCLWRSTAASPLQGWIRLSSGVAQSFVPNRNARIPSFMQLPESQVNCPSLILQENAGTMTVQGATTKITVTLVA